MELSCALQVLPVPGYYLRKHDLLMQEFQNSTHWPKHLLVRYHWTHSNALNINAALYVLFGAGKFLVLTVESICLCKCHRSLGQVTPTECNSISLNSLLMDIQSYIWYDIVNPLYAVDKMMRHLC